MRFPDIPTAIGPDEFIGRKERLVIGRIEHGGAVITDPKTSGEKAAARSLKEGGLACRRAWLDLTAH